MAGEAMASEASDVRVIAMLSLGVAQASLAPQAGLCMSRQVPRKKAQPKRQRLSHVLSGSSFWLKAEAA